MLCFSFLLVGLLLTCICLFVFLVNYDVKDVNLCIQPHPTPDSQMSSVSITYYYSPSLPPRKVKMVSAKSPMVDGKT